MESSNCDIYTIENILLISKLIFNYSCYLLYIFFVVHDGFGINVGSSNFSLSALIIHDCQFISENSPVFGIHILS